MKGNSLWGLGGTADFNTESTGLSIHWYGYATSGSVTTNRATRLNKELYNWDRMSDCYTNDWLSKAGQANGHLYLFRTAAMVCKVVIVNSSGSSTDPYTLTLN